MVAPSRDDSFKTIEALFQSSQRLLETTPLDVDSYWVAGEHAWKTFQREPFPFLCLAYRIPCHLALLLYQNDCLSTTYQTLSIEEVKAHIFGALATVFLLIKVRSIIPPAAVLRHQDAPSACCFALVLSSTRLFPLAPIMFCARLRYR